ncbi:branched-chain alpha-ketoacid dehydrogenase [Zopfochytrium polystomum]|nr:branched-chain alpha-ketoacid dehydrogenase [Zopfochytrium polystomum]
MVPPIGRLRFVHGASPSGPTSTCRRAPSSTPTTSSPHHQLQAASFSTSPRSHPHAAPAIAGSFVNDAASLGRARSGSPPKRSYSIGVLEKYAAKETKRVTLRQLTVFGRNLNEEKLIRSANYVREELAVRLAHRIQDFHQLPFIVGTNPHFKRLIELYGVAFDTFRNVPEITSLEANREFCKLVQMMLTTHLVVIPQLAMGIAETAHQMDPRAADKFMNEMLRSRIGRRVLAEQHLALSNRFDRDFSLPGVATLGGNRDRSDSSSIGIVDTQCHAQRVASRCGVLSSNWFRSSFSFDNLNIPPPPNIIIDGDVDTTFTYIPDHIEYILFELLKNSMQFSFKRHTPELYEAAVRKAEERDLADQFSTPTTGPADQLDGFTDQTVNDRPVLPTIRITVGSGPSEVTFRVSDQGGGIPKEIQDSIWSYSSPAKRAFLNFNRMPELAAVVNERVPPTLNLGLGLPMSRVYANYWGGTLHVHSMNGYGTDAYVKISVANQLENLTYDGEDVEL